MNKKNLSSLVNVLKILKLIITKQHDNFDNKLKTMLELIKHLNKYYQNVFKYIRNIDIKQKSEFKIDWDKFEKEFPDFDFLTSELKISNKEISDKLEDIDYFLDNINLE